MHRLELPHDIRKLINAAIAVVAGEKAADKPPASNVIPFRRAAAGGRVR
ncbi:hypothetical protein GGE45_003568 [Rhizobium aethiopicum]|uniref:Uncharacterized protein n=1 Tax=Rhizobium aethiopicum TaxID=1138170 RepID=A0A7W6VQJ5_9HYPH|nr:hypothetical protein [Rhizobium aethiopicum]MBB4194055.1 hypothetical protein [Rhizobium aethiopicum]MBB4581224.1 hypothetical protein [Rhizobium aethiopicum]